jgi:hypothetical protein
MSQLLFPAKIGARWILYTWHLRHNEVSVFDPAEPDGDAEAVHHFHNVTIQKMVNFVQNMAK